MDFSIMFFSGSEGRSASERYRDIRDVAREADASGLKRIWVPERHFVQFGALHPSPAVLAAHLAACTETIRIAAGSIVAPLHDSIRIAEDWSVVDNLSGGRVDLALASGWLASDFVLAHGHYDTRQQQLRRKVREVRDLWHGASLTRTVDGSSHEISIRPRPVQSTLPLWITAARSTDTFRYAGSIGCNVLTYLVDLGFAGLEAAIAAYRDARSENGFEPDEGCVTVMVHTFLGDDSRQVRETIAAPYRTYLLGNRNLLLQSERSAALDEAALAEMADIQFGRVFENLSLIGSFEAAQNTLDRLVRIGVNEVACLIDFVDDPALVLNSVARIAALAAGRTSRSPASPSEGAGGVPDLVADRRQFYDYIGSLGGYYGEEFRLVDHVSLRGNRAETKLTVHDASEQGNAILVDAIISTAHAFALRPGLRAASVPLAMPAGVGSMAVEDIRPGSVTVSTTATGRRGNLEYFDAVAHDDLGNRVAELRDISFNRLKLAPSDPRIASAMDVIHETAWLPVEADGITGSETAFVIHALLPEDADAWLAAFRAAGFEARRAADAKRADAGIAKEWHVLAAGVQPAGHDVLASAQRVTCDITSWVEDLRKRVVFARWIVVTQGAQRLADDDALPEPAAAAAWAAACSLADPVSSAREGVVDVTEAHPTTASCIARALAVGYLPVAVRGNIVFRLTLRPAGKAGNEAVRERLQPAPTDGALVTGGSGALGIALTEWLGEEEVSPIATISRRPASGMHGIERTSVVHCRGDVASEAVDDILIRMGLKSTDFGTIFHLAGVDLPETEGIVQDRTAAIFAPKLHGLMNLASLLDDETPKHLVFFSSLAAIRGSLGQTAYSAANAATAAAVRQLVAKGPHRATIVHFGPWAGAGMAAVPGLGAILAMKGVERLPPEIALRAFGLALATGRDELVIAKFVETATPGHSLPAIEKTLVDGRRPDLRGVGLQAFRSIGPSLWRDRLVERLRVTIAETLECDVDDVTEDANLFDLGFDSLMAVELRNTLAEEYDVEVGLVVLMGATNIIDVVDRLLPIIEAALGPAARGVAAENREQTLII